MSAGLRDKLVWLSLFAVSMAYLESAVVVYLRALLFPNGFSFPLPPLQPLIIVTEIGREAATIVMLLAPAAMLAARRMQRFAWFLIAFGVWDIFYYVWLKVLLGWPESLFAMDILFLVPVPWVGPVLAPSLVSIGLISLGVLLLIGAERHGRFGMHWGEWWLCSLGAAVVLWSFMGDHIVHALDQGISTLSDGPAYRLQETGLDAAFSWPLFITGTGLAFAGITLTGRRALVPAVAHALPDGDRSQKP